MAAYVLSNIQHLHYIIMFLKVQEDIYNGGLCIIMDIEFATLHHIDLNSRNIIFRTIKEQDTKDYIKTTINNILSKEDSRLFTLQSDNKEVISAINEFISERNNSQIETDDVIADSTNIIANRLLDCEIDTNNNIAPMGREVQKGSLIQSFLEDIDQYIYIIIKVEHSAFIDEKDLIKHIGLPYEKVVLKTCLIQFSKEFDVINIKIGDSNSRLSKYWWHDFLELREINTDEYNTNRSFQSIDVCLSKNLKNQSPYDYFTLRNATIGYFRGHRSFSFDDYYKNVFSDYEPDNNTLNMEKIKTKIKWLPQNKKFDSRFDIVQNEIKAKIKNVYKINDKIELKLLDHIENVHSIIKADKNELGEKILKIRIDNDEIYKTFHHQDD